MRFLLKVTDNANCELGEYNSSLENVPHLAAGGIPLRGHRNSAKVIFPVSWTSLVDHSYFQIAPITSVAQYCAHVLLFLTSSRHNKQRQFQQNFQNDEAAVRILFSTEIMIQPKNSEAIFRNGNRQVGFLFTSIVVIHVIQQL